MQTFKTIERTLEDQPMNIAANVIAIPEEEFDHVAILDSLGGLIIYLLDVSSNISVFLKIYEPAKKVLCNENFINQ